MDRRVLLAGVRGEHVRQQVRARRGLEQRGIRRDLPGRVATTGSMPPATALIVTTTFPGPTMTVESLTRTSVKASIDSA
jgi:hypothetical protein